MKNVRNIVVTVFVIIVIVLLWFAPQLQGRYFSDGVRPQDLPALVNEYRRTWAQIIAGFVLLLGLYLTWRRVEISQQTLEVSQDQQVTERFTRAIDQLGASDEQREPRLEIRVGGIYALERIARDSIVRDYSTVTEVLMAYVRENAAWPTGASKSVGFPPNIEIGHGSKLTFEAVRRFLNPPSSEHVRGVSADIQAALKVLGRREETSVPPDLRVHLDLRGTDLAGVNLEGANFAAADLSHTNLTDAKLHGADLTGSFLYKSRFWEAVLSRASLRDTMLWEADLSGAIAFEADFSKAALRRACLSGATLQRSNLSGADLSEADLSTIEIVRRDSDSGSVVSTHTRGTDLSRTNLSNTDLTDALLSAVDLSGADLSGADLSGADLSGANLTAVVGLTQEQLEKATGTTDTVLPEALMKPLKWTRQPSQGTMDGAF